MVCGPQQRPRSGTIVFGAKSIGTLGSFCLLYNNISGPGLVAMPTVVASAGWLATGITFVGVYILSTLASTFLVEAMAHVPRNRTFDRQVQYSTLAKENLGIGVYRIFLAVLCLAFLSSNVANFIVGVQMTDFALVSMWGSCALEFYPNFMHASCVHSAGTSITPFGDGVVVITLGFVLIGVIVLVASSFNLDNQKPIQIAAVFLTVLLACYWLSIFVLGEGLGLSNFSVPAIGPYPYAAIGPVMYNLAAASSVPSWVNEKSPHVNINALLWSSSGAVSIMYMSVGVLGAMAFSIPPSSDLLTALNDWPHATWLVKTTVMVMPLIAYVTTIPVVSIMLRYNLVANHICSRRWAFFWANVGPIVCAIMFYSGSGLFEILTWAGLVLLGATNFLFPFILFLYCDKPVRARAVPVIYTPPVLNAEPGDMALTRATLASNSSVATTVSSATRASLASPALSEVSADTEASSLLDAEKGLLEMPRAHPPRMFSAVPCLESEGRGLVVQKRIAASLLVTSILGMLYVIVQSIVVAAL